MDCASTREALSAVMDGEDAGVAASEVKRHMAGCSACARWHAAAARLDRRVRVTPVTGTEPDVAGAVLARVRLPRRGRWRLPVRIALAVVAVAQLGIGLCNLFGPIGLHVAMRASAHMDHEEAAFNLAFGAALLLVAVNTRAARNHLPVLASFVLVLGVASVVDLVDGAVGWPRLATHAPIVAGLLLLAVLARGPNAGHGPAVVAGQGSPTARPATHRSALDDCLAEQTAGEEDAPPPAAYRETA